jgi:hypothetical protein
MACWKHWWLDGQRRTINRHNSHTIIYGKLCACITPHKFAIYGGVSAILTLWESNHFSTCYITL